jgi:hypothetical protein
MRLGSLVVILSLFAVPARAQVHQMLCSSVDAPGVTLTALPGRRVLVGACGTYLVLHAERGAHGLSAVGDATFAWGGAAAAPTDGADPDSLHTMTPLVSDFAGATEPEVALGFAQYSAHGGARGGGVYLVPMRDDGTFGRATHPYRGTPAAITTLDADADARMDLVVLEYGEPFTGHRGAASIYVRGRRTRRIADLIMAPVAGGVLGAGAGAQLLVTAQGYTGETDAQTTQPSLATVLPSGGTPSIAPLPHDGWMSVYGDFDADGQLDVAFAGSEGIYLASPSLDHVRVVDRQATRTLGVVDLDGSGPHALSFCTNDHFRVATCDATRCWSVPWLGASCESFGAVLITDLDGDGTREMLMANREHYQDDESRSAVWLTFIPAPAMHTGVRVIEQPFTAGRTITLR